MIETSSSPFELFWTSLCAFLPEASNQLKSNCGWNNVWSKGLRDSCKDFWDRFYTYMIPATKSTVQSQAKRKMRTAQKLNVRIHGSLFLRKPQCTVLPHQLSLRYLWEHLKKERDWNQGLWAQHRRLMAEIFHRTWTNTSRASVSRLRIDKRHRSRMYTQSSNISGAIRALPGWKNKLTPVGELLISSLMISCGVEPVFLSVVANVYR